MNRRLLRKYDGKKHGWLRLAMQVAAVAVITLIVVNFVIGFSFVSGDSMEPTIEDGNLAIYLRICNTYDHGDIVVVKMPTGERYVKRVIAVEGDIIDIRNNDVYINGNLIDEPYIEGDTMLQDTFVKYPLKIEDEAVFIMGDNRSESIDSRSFGTISVNQIKGKLCCNTKCIKL